MSRTTAPASAQATAGQILRAWRSSANLSQEFASDLLGMSQSYLSDLERDKRPVTTQMLDRLERSGMVDANTLYALHVCGARQAGWKV